MTKIYAARWIVPVSSPVIEDGAVAVDARHIIAVGSQESLKLQYPEAKVDDFGYAAIIPGLVNCHSHLELTAMRGYLEDVEHEFFAWLRKLTVARMTQMTSDDLYISAICGVMENARAGITCVGDASSAGLTSMMAVIDGGLRGHIYQEVFGPDPSAATDSFDGLQEKLTELRSRESKLVRASVSPHAPYTVSRPLLELVSEYAVSERLPLMIHAAESAAEERFLKEGTGPFAEGFFQRSIEWTPPGVSTIKYLDSVGLLRTRPLLAHCIRVDEEDVQLIKSTGSGIAHCPKSNAKLFHGRAPFAAFLRAGVKVGLGSDSVASNNCSDMFEEGRFATLLARSVQSAVEDGLTVTADHALWAATLGGASAMGLDDQIGSLEPGKDADLAVVSFNAIHQQPVYDPLSTLIFSSSGGDVLMTMVAGREVYRDGLFDKLDTERFAIRLSEIRQKLFAPE
jgi:cytosine/adenosine deaminase-related metal-dependent hydrolase